MTITGGDAESAGTRAGLIATTHWTVVVTAAGLSSSQADTLWTRLRGWGFTGCGRGSDRALEL
jgi:hypothetical protein